MTKLECMRLWDIYHALLTEHQQEITDLYFNYDLTLSEIAEAKGISRQGVSECLNACKSQLADYEEKLHVLHLYEEWNAKTAFLVRDVKKALSDLQERYPAMQNEAESILKLLNKDYTAEVQTALQNKTQG